MKKISNHTPKLAKWWFALKLLISGAAFYLAFQMVDIGGMRRAFLQVDLLLIVVGLILYLASQWLSSQRLMLFVKRFRTAKRIDGMWNHRLYFVGMAYNLFLPGGIGGDAYKVFLYEEKLKAPKRRIVSGLLLDRISGLLAILLLLCMLPFYRHETFETWFGLLWWIPVGIVFFLAYRMVLAKFKRFVRAMVPAVFMAIGVQLLQVFSMLILAMACGLSDYSVAITAVFLLSSLATAIPAFLGGLGAREVVFAALAATFGYASSDAVSAAILFSAITVVSAIPGLVLSLKKF